MTDLGSDLDLRLVRYFCVVAEHRSFSRAAAELHVAQPALSRQIQRLEGRLGLRLFERTPRGALLTKGGEAFLPEAQALLRAARRAVSTARAHAPGGTLIVGYVEDLVVTPAVRELRRRHPGAVIATRHLECDEAAFADGAVDVLVARAPLHVSADDVRLTPLYNEPRMVVVPADHRLAGRPSVTPADLVGENLVCPHGGALGSHPPDALAEAPLGRRSAGPVGESFEDRLELVAGGLAVALLPVGDRRPTLRPDLVTIPAHGLAASEVVVVSHTADPNPLVAEFLRTARARLTAAIAP
ncbi:LysR family transcriptional regulator [Mycobacterium sp. MYCO198283]|uniref:LysR family transcriptional regulator n=1 Tax=Mycobacterium sp. MYCO198283 TaxID=2883505 RepID=UPI001E38306C|nr:LysR family transcriptional regulator [Mycobacterium sp. MYCO198283]MCG5433319.1 LysR family transcriptional regulator [Mycobacterium sp. MYCO198283]